MPAIMGRLVPDRSLSEAPASGSGPKTWPDSVVPDQHRHKLTRPQRRHGLPPPFDVGPVPRGDSQRNAFFSSSAEIVTSIPTLRSSSSGASARFRRSRSSAHVEHSSKLDSSPLRMYFAQ